MESAPSRSRQKSLWDEHDAAFMPNHCFKNGPMPYGTPLIEPAYVQSCSRMMLPKLRGAQPSTLNSGVTEFRAVYSRCTTSASFSPHITICVPWHCWGILQTCSRVTGFELTRFMTGGDHCSPSREPEHKVAAPPGRAPGPGPGLDMSE